MFTVPQRPSAPTARLTTPGKDAVSYQEMLLAPPLAFILASADASDEAQEHARNLLAC
jgi:hypothetical protein